MSARFVRSMCCLVTVFVCACMQQASAAGVETGRSDVTVYGKDSLSICENAFPLRYGDTTFLPGTKTGVFTIRFVTGANSDSVVRLTLQVQPTYKMYDTVRICPSQLPYQYGGKWFTDGGEYLVQNFSKMGCDSITYLSLQVFRYPTEYDTLHICQSAFPFRYGLSLIMDKGDYDVNFRSKDGCDSLVKLTVIAEQSYRVPLYMHLCTNDLPYEYGDRKITDTGHYVVSLRSLSNCDSVVDLHVTIGHPSFTSFVDTICRGESYSKNGYNISSDVFTTDYFIINGRKPGANKEGCDSSYTITVRIMPVYEQNDSLLVCDGDLPIKRHGRSFLAAGDYAVTLQTIHGCDSVINFCLQTTKSYQFVRTEHFCAGTAYKIGDSVYREAGRYHVVMRTRGGCDSIVDLTLVKDDRAPYTPGQIYTKKDLYETDKQTFWISSVPNAAYYRWSYTNLDWLPIGTTNDYVFALRNVMDGDTGTVSVVAGNSCGISGFSRIQVLPTALVEAEEEYRILLYPNPANERTVLDLGGMPAKSVSLCDVSGRQLLVLPVSDSRVEIPLQQVSAGYYLIRIMDERGVLRTLPLLRQ